MKLFFIFHKGYSLFLEATIHRMGVSLLTYKKDEFQVTKHQFLLY